MGGSLGQQLMGGSSSQSNMAQVTDSMQEQLARQALFFPTSSALFESMRPLQAAQEAAQNQYAPYTATGEDALNELRFYMGMAPLDPLMGSVGRLEELMAGMTAPEAARVNAQGVPISEQLLSKGQPGSLVGGNTPLYNEYLRLQGGGKTYNDVYAMQAGIAANRNAAIQQGLQPGQSVTSGPVSVSGRDFTPAIIGAADYPQVFEPRTQADLLDRYTYSSASNINYLNSPLRNISTGLSSILNSDDPEARQKAYDDLLSNFDTFQDRVSQVNRGYFGTDTRGVKLSEIAGDISKLQKEIEGSFSATPQAAPTADQISEKLKQDPGYQFRYEQGTDAAMKGASATGLLGSGRMLKELERFGQDLASQQYQQTISNLAGLAGFGPAAAQGTAQAAQTTAPQISSTLQDMGRVWNMSPWTSMGLSRSHSEGASQSTTSSSQGGLGSLLGFAAGSG